MKLEVLVSRVLHAGYIFESENTKIIFDPILETPFSGNCQAFPEIEFLYPEITKLKFDAIFISHFHEDHCSLKSLRHLDFATPIYLYCLHDELFDLIRQLGFQNVHSLQIGQSVQIKEFRVIPRLALDPDIDCLFQISVGDFNILNLVDSWMDPSSLKLLSSAPEWDLVLWPFQTMRELEVLTPSRAEPADGKLPIEWLEQMRQLQPRVIIPSSCQFSMESWSWYNFAFFPISYKSFTEQVQSFVPSSKIQKVNPGQVYRLTKNGFQPLPSLNWIRPIANQELDYQYNPDKIPAATSDIAGYFPELSSVEKNWVFDFCETTVLERYKDLGDSDLNYFLSQQVWKLCLYDQDGSCKEYFYEIEADRISLSSKGEHFTWLTELPLTKLYLALKKGESLTSMYIRVNDCKFIDLVEAALQEADCLEDPLIRILFNGVFGAYQKAELVDIKSNSKKLESVFK